MECRDVRELADSFLAEELLTETSHELLRHLDTCPLCHGDLEARRALREGVRRAFQSAPSLAPSPEFMAQLQAKLNRSTGHVPARRRTMSRGWWALAATVVLAASLGIGYLGRDWMMTTGALGRAAVGDHRDCALEFRLAERSISLEAATARYGGPTYRILETLPPDDVMTSAGLAHVLKRHACIYQGRRFAHIVFEYRGQLVSLLVTAADGSGQLALPGDAVPHVTSAGRIGRTPVVSFRTPRFAVFLTGDVAAGDLSALANVVAGPLYRELAGA